jgi:hypothetical protein
MFALVGRILCGMFSLHETLTRDTLYAKTENIIIDNLSLSDDNSV